MANKKTNQGSNSKGKFLKELGPTWLWLIPSSALLIKLITLVNIPGHMWLGSDGESYLNGVNALLKSGLFSKEGILQYFPAGYPILIWILAKLSLSGTLVLLGIFQTLVFTFATWYFGKSLINSRIQVLLPWIIFLISFNPTLSLASLAVGYESLVSSLLLVSFGILWKFNVEKSKYKTILNFGLVSSLIAFMQPRYLATSIIILLIWLLKNVKKKEAVKLSAVALIAIMVFPLGLVLRNQQATGKAFISNNLGTTMNVGAGPESTGGYTNKATGVKCPDTVKTDNQKVLCILKWYATNPGQTLRLSLNKTLYLFSPWSGPLANGTMARNPWLKVNPVTSIAKTQGGYNTVYGAFGKVISWAWELGQIELMLWGAIWLWRQGGELRNLSLLASTSIAITWLIALATIGDHRFRIPVMGFIFLLQVAGLRGFSKSPLVLKAPAKKR